MSITLTHATLRKHQADLTREEMAEIVRRINAAPAVVTQARRAYPRNPRAQMHFERGFYAELTGAKDGLTASQAEASGRAACREQYGLDAPAAPGFIALRLASPLRASAGRAIKPQADAAHLPLFITANEPALL